MGAISRLMLLDQLARKESATTIEAEKGFIARMGVGNVSDQLVFRGEFGLTNATGMGNAQLFLNAFPRSHTVSF